MMGIKQARGSLRSRHKSFVAENARMRTEAFYWQLCTWTLDSFAAPDHNCNSRRILDGRNNIEELLYNLYNGIHFKAIIPSDPFTDTTKFCFCLSTCDVSTALIYITSICDILLQSIKVFCIDIPNGKTFSSTRSTANCNWLIGQGTPVKSLVEYLWCTKNWQLQEREGKCWRGYITFGQEGQSIGGRGRFDGMLVSLCWCLDYILCAIAH